MKLETVEYFKKQEKETKHPHGQVDHHISPPQMNVFNRQQNFLRTLKNAHVVAYHDIGSA
jgi:hypothetical protein